MRKSITVAALVALMFPAGCGSSGKSVSEQVIEQLRLCNLVTEGEVGANFDSEDPFTDCFFQCLAEATCATVEEWLCEFGIPLDLYPCLDACIPPFDCGDGTTVFAHWECDGDVDCATGADEASCPDYFFCTDRSDSLDPDEVCDGWDDCNDGSDEANCPTFSCLDGSDDISETWVCDGFDDCNDGSDEAGCNFFTCADGSGDIPESFVCDGWDDCADGSEEMGCPGFRCTDGFGNVADDQLCDGIGDCVDYSDEQDCAGFFVCADGSRGVPPSYVCDLFESCPDGSDEDGCADPICPVP